MLIKPHREAVKRLIATEKAARGIKTPQISEALKAYGIEQSPANLRAKIGTGRMDAGLFLAIMDVLGVQSLKIPDLIRDIRKAPGADDPEVF